ncbi:MAG: hypothetical protein V3T72_10670 [Thermoanaerobaculia bacterium]
MRTIGPTIIGLVLLAAAAARPALAEPPPMGKPATVEELPASVREARNELGDILRRWEQDEEALGERRRQRLAVARFHLRAEDFGRSLADDPNALEETTDILRSCVGKLAREVVERRLGVDRLERRFNRPDPEPGTVRLRFSPRVALGGDNAYLGARLRLVDGTDQVWSRFALGYSERLERDERSVYLQYDGDDSFLRLEHVDGSAGEEIGLSVRWKWR